MTDVQTIEEYMENEEFQNADLEGRLKLLDLYKKIVRDTAIAEGWGWEDKDFEELDETVESYRQDEVFNTSVDNRWINLMAVHRADPDYLYNYFKEAEEGFARDDNGSLDEINKAIQRYGLDPKTKEDAANEIYSFEQTEEEQTGSLGRRGWAEKRLKMKDRYDLLFADEKERISLNGKKPEPLTKGNAFKTVLQNLGRDENLDVELLYNLAYESEAQRRSGFWKNFMDNMKWLNPFENINMSRESVDNIISAINLAADGRLDDNIKGNITQEAFEPTTTGSWGNRGAMFGQSLEFMGEIAVTGGVAGLSRPIVKASVKETLEKVRKKGWSSVADALEKKWKEQGIDTALDSVQAVPKEVIEQIAKKKIAGKAVNPAQFLGQSAKKRVANKAGQIVKESFTKFPSFMALAAPTMGVRNVDRRMKPQALIDAQSDTPPPTIPKEWMELAKITPTDNFFEAVAKETTSLYAEFLSEGLGNLVPASQLVDKLKATRLMMVAKSRFPKEALHKSIGKVAGLIERGGYNGILPEIGEEQVSKTITTFSDYFLGELLGKEKAESMKKDMLTLLEEGLLTPEEVWDIVYMSLALNTVHEATGAIGSKMATLEARRKGWDSLINQREGTFERYRKKVDQFDNIPTQREQRNVNDPDIDLTQSRIDDEEFANQQSEVEKIIGPRRDALQAKADEQKATPEELKELGELKAIRIVRDAVDMYDPDLQQDMLQDDEHRPLVEALQRSIEIASDIWSRYGGRKIIFYTDPRNYGRSEGKGVKKGIIDTEGSDYMMIRIDPPLYQGKSKKTTSNYYFQAMGHETYHQAIYKDPVLRQKFKSLIKTDSDLYKKVKDAYPEATEDEVSEETEAEAFAGIVQTAEFWKAVEDNNKDLGDRVLEDLYKWSDAIRSFLGLTDGQSVGIKTLDQMKMEADDIPWLDALKNVEQAIETAEKILSSARRRGTPSEIRGSEQRRRAGMVETSVAASKARVKAEQRLEAEEKEAEVSETLQRQQERLKQKRSQEQIQERKKERKAETEIAKEELKRSVTEGVEEIPRQAGRRLVVEEQTELQKNLDEYARSQDRSPKQLKAIQDDINKIAESEVRKRGLPESAVKDVQNILDKRFFTKERLDKDIEQEGELGLENVLDTQKAYGPVPKSGERPDINITGQTGLENLPEQLLARRQNPPSGSFLEFATQIERGDFSEIDRAIEEIESENEQFPDGVNTQYSKDLETFFDPNSAQQVRDAIGRIDAILSNYSTEEIADWQRHLDPEDRLELSRQYRIIYDKRMAGSAIRESDGMIARMFRSSVDTYLDESDIYADIKDEWGEAVDEIPMGPVRQRTSQALWFSNGIGFQVYGFSDAVTQTEANNALAPHEPYYYLHDHSGYGPDGIVLALQKEAERQAAMNVEQSFVFDLYGLAYRMYNSGRLHPAHGANIDANEMFNILVRTDEDAQWLADLIGAEWGKSDVSKEVQAVYVDVKNPLRINAPFPDEHWMKSKDEISDWIMAMINALDLNGRHLGDRETFFRHMQDSYKRLEGFADVGYKNVYDAFQPLRNWIQDRFGYDGIISPSLFGSHEQVVTAFHGHQIKSAEPVELEYTGEEDVPVQAVPPLARALGIGPKNNLSYSKDLELDTEFPNEMDRVFARTIAKDPLLAEIYYMDHVEKVWTSHWTLTHHKYKIGAKTIDFYGKVEELYLKYKEVLRAASGLDRFDFMGSAYMSKKIVQDNLNEGIEVDFMMIDDLKDIAENLVTIAYAFEQVDEYHREMEEKGLKDYESVKDRIIRSVYIFRNMPYSRSIIDRIITGNWNQDNYLALMLDYHTRQNNPFGRTDSDLYNWNTDIEEGVKRYLFPLIIHLGIKKKNLRNYFSTEEGGIYEGANEDKIKNLITFLSNASNSRIHDKIKTWYISSFDFNQESAAKTIVLRFYNSILTQQKVLKERKAKQTAQLNDEFRQMPWIHEEPYDQFVHDTPEDILQEWNDIEDAQAWIDWKRNNNIPEDYVPNYISDEFIFSYMLQHPNMSWDNWYLTAARVRHARRNGGEFAANYGKNWQDIPFPMALPSTKNIKPLNNVSEYKAVGEQYGFCIRSHEGYWREGLEGRSQICSIVDDTGEHLGAVVINDVKKQADAIGMPTQSSALYGVDPGDWSFVSNFNAKPTKQMEKYVFDYLHALNREGLEKRDAQERGQASGGTLQYSKDLERSLTNRKPRLTYQDNTDLEAESTPKWTFAKDRTMNGIGVAFRNGVVEFIKGPSNVFHAKHWRNIKNDHPFRLVDGVVVWTDWHDDMSIRDAVANKVWSTFAKEPLGHKTMAGKNMFQGFNYSRDLDSFDEEKEIKSVSDLMKNKRAATLATQKAIWSEEGEQVDADEEGRSPMQQIEEDTFRDPDGIPWPTRLTFQDLMEAAERERERNKKQPRSNIGNTPEVRAVIDLFRSLNEAVTPKRTRKIKLAQNRAAREFYKNPYRWTVKIISEKWSVDEDVPNSAYRTYMLRLALNYTFKKAIENNTPEAFALAQMLQARWDKFRTNLSYAFSAGRDYIQTTQERMQNDLLRAMMFMNEKNTNALLSLGSEQERFEYARDYMKGHLRKLRKILQKKGLGTSLPGPNEMWDRKLFAKYLNAIQQAHSGFDDKAWELFRNYILFGWHTQAVNLVGGLLNTTYEMLIVKWVEAGLNQIGASKIPGLTNNKSLATYENFKNYKKAFVTSVKHGALNFAYTYMTEHRSVDPDAVTSKDVIGTGKTAIAGWKIVPVPWRENGEWKIKFTDTGRVVRLPQRLMSSVDEFIKTIAFESERYAVAANLATEAGLEPNSDEWQVFVNEQIHDPESQASIEGLQQARTGTFQEEAGTIAKSFSQLRESDNFWVRWLIRLNLPFIGTPANIIRQGYRKSPLNAIPLLAMLGWNNAIMVGNRRIQRQIQEAKDAGDRSLQIELEQELEYRSRRIQNIEVQHIAEQVIALALTTLVFANGDDEDKFKDGSFLPLFKGIQITGSGVAYGLASRGEVEFERRRGNRPRNSIKLFGKWRDYSRLEPIATTLSAIADLKETIRIMVSNDIADQDKKWGYAVERLFQKLAGQVSRKTYMEGADSILRSFDMFREGEAGEAVKQFALDIGSSFAVPNLFRQADRNWDEYYRDTSAQTPMERFRDVLSTASPFHDKKSPVQIDIWGRTMRRTVDDGPDSTGGALFRVLSPFGSVDARTQPHLVDQLLENYNRKFVGNDKVRGSYYPRMPTIRQLQVEEKNMNRVKPPMTPKQYHDFKVYRGRIASNALLRFYKRHPEFVENPSITDKKIIQNEFKKATQLAKEMVGY